MIVLVNIIGGFVIGVWQKGMPLDTALANYTLLTIGRGAGGPGPGADHLDRGRHHRHPLRRREQLRPRDRGPAPQLPEGLPGRLGRVVPVRHDPGPAALRLSPALRGLLHGEPESVGKGGGGGGFGRRDGRRGGSGPDQLDPPARHAGAGSGLRPGPDGGREPAGRTSGPDPLDPQAVRGPHGLHRPADPHPRQPAVKAVRIQHPDQRRQGRRRRALRAVPGDGFRRRHRSTGGDQDHGAGLRPAGGLDQGEGAGAGAGFGLHGGGQHHHPRHPHLRDHQEARPRAGGAPGTAAASGQHRGDASPRWWRNWSHPSSPSARCSGW